MPTAEQRVQNIILQYYPHASPMKPTMVKRIIEEISAAPIAEPPWVAEVRDMLLRLERLTATTNSEVAVISGHLQAQAKRRINA